MVWAPPSTIHPVPRNPDSSNKTIWFRVRSVAFHRHRKTAGVFPACVASLGWSLLWSDRSHRPPPFCLHGQVQGYRPVPVAPGLASVTHCRTTRSAADSGRPPAVWRFSAPAAVRPQPALSAAALPRPGLLQGSYLPMYSLALEGQARCFWAPLCWLLGHSSTDRPGVNIVMSVISIKIATIGQSWALITNIKSVSEYILPFENYSLRQFWHLSWYDSMLLHFFRIV